MERLLNFRFIVFLSLSLCLGIFTANLFIFHNAFSGIVVLLLSLIFISLYFLPYKKGNKAKVKAIFCALFTIFFIFGACNFTLTVKNFENSNLNGGFYSVGGKVKEILQTDDGVRLLLKDLSIQGKKNGKLKYNAYLFVNGNCDLEIGDIVNFSTVLIDNSAEYEQRFSSTYVLRKIKYTAFISANELSVLSKSPDIFDMSNNFIKSTLSKGLSGDEFGVAYALLTGHSEFMDYDTLTSYRYAGVAHIFAVSGLHIGFLATAVGFLLLKLRVKRALRVLIIFPILLFYSGVCGFSASSIRATVMVTVSLLVAINGDRNDGLTSVAFSSIIVLLISPAQLFYVGFQLSFIVVLGMILLSKPISKCFKFLPDKVANSLGGVLSAQLSAIPISLSAFGHFSFISIIANLIFIPLVSVIFISLLIAVIFGGLFNVVDILLFPLKYVLVAVNFLINAFDYKIFIVGGFFLGGFTVFYYLAMVLSSGLVNLHARVRLLSVLLSTVICILGTVCINITDFNAVKMYASGAKTISATVISVKNENTLIVSDVNYIYNIGRLKRLNEKGITELDNVVLMGGMGVDAQVFLTKLRTAFDIKRVYYYGDDLDKQQNIINKSFPEVEVFAPVTSKVPVSGFSCEFKNHGRMLELKIKDKIIAIFSKIDLSVGFSETDKEYDLIIAGDLHERIFALFSAKEKLSYLRSSVYYDAESKGNVYYKFN